MIDARTPILVGVGQLTQRTARQGNLATSLDPVALLARAAQLALHDCAAPVLAAIDTVTAVRFTADSPGDQGRLPRGMFRNPALSVARKIGADPRRCFYSATGGNTPQSLVNRFAEEIAGGECDAALLVGGECLATYLAAVRQGVDPGWGRGEDGDPGEDPIEIGDMRPGTSSHEKAYGLNFPVNAYPLFENAIRNARRRGIDDHLLSLGKLFSPFSKVAAGNPCSWFPKFRAPEEIATPSETNRFVGFPYTKFLNAVIEVDMAAAVVIVSVAKALELGVPKTKWVFLHGCADANDIWNLGDRVNYFTSPAIRAMGREALAMAGIAVADLAYIDLYSCFPAAVELACEELGIAEDDPRGLTITGGLPYFGGPGNNYVMHSIATMVEKLRAAPGAFGLCTGNGWYVTKHSAGIFSTKPVEGAWTRKAPASTQREIDGATHPVVTETPEGQAIIETYTVATDRKARRFGIIVGRLGDGSRFFAHTPSDAALLDRMTRDEMVGRPGNVAATPDGNLFYPL
ncbi:MAG TPA: acetyl-CoA acetyltransferase [Rhizomicrobium sp.]|jgi:acetyl-CoA C-acetyltransferase